VRGGWIGNSVSADDGLEGKLQDNNFRFSTTKFLTSCEQSLRTIELLFLTRYPRKKNLALTREKKD